MTSNSIDPNYSLDENSQLSSNDEALEGGNEEKDFQIALLTKKLHKRSEELRIVSELFDSMEASIAWRMIQPFRRVFFALFPKEGKLGSFNRKIRSGLRSLLDSGIRELFKGSLSPQDRTPTGTELELVDAPSAEDADFEDKQERLLVVCDEPNFTSRPNVFGSVTFIGWALASSGIERLEFYVNGELIGNARYGNLRPDVGHDYSEFMDADRSGFKFIWDSSSSHDGSHEITMKAVSKLGDEFDFTGEVMVDNTTKRKSDYQEWIDTFETRDIEEARQYTQSLIVNPKISIIMPVYNTDPEFLERAISSVLGQAYENWELCICDDGSTDEGVINLLKHFHDKDPRIKVKRLEKNSGIAIASNGALSLASGEYIALMDSDDEIPPHSLYFVAKVINEDGDVDFIYSDEDKIDIYNRRFDPFFKPDWSPDLFLSVNYLNHFTALHAGRMRDVSGFREEFEGSQDYDLYLRVLENAKRIIHIPKILYHWRAVSSSGAEDPQAKMFAQETAKMALEDSLQREGVNAEVQEGEKLGRWRIRYNIIGEPKVSIIIPCGGSTKLLEQCIEGIAEKTRFPNYEVVVVDNSRAELVEKFFLLVQEMVPRSSYVDYRYKPFNFSALNNLAVRSTDSDLILFLNDDTDPINVGWLEAMVEHAQRPSVGAVGATMFYSDGSVQHVGALMGPGNCTDHAFRGLSGEEYPKVYFGVLQVVRNYSVVTAACLMTRREVFNEVGGFDEVHLPVAFQDVDYCLKVRAKGYSIVCTPYSQLWHDESKTKEEKIPNYYEVLYMQRNWAHVISHDPFFNPNFSRSRTDFLLALPGRP